jgi:hypothetical protein
MDPSGHAEIEPERRKTEAIRKRRGRETRGSMLGTVLSPMTSCGELKTKAAASGSDLASDGPKFIVHHEDDCRASKSDKRSYAITRGLSESATTTSAVVSHRLVPLGRPSYPAVSRDTEHCVAHFSETRSTHEEYSTSIVICQPCNTTRMVSPFWVPDAKKHL